MGGWIRLHRKIQDHWLYEEKRKFSKFEAWIDMLMMANHKDNKFVLGNELVEVKRGQFVTSELKLMERWGWGKSKLRSFLEILEKDGMIVKISDRKKTTITICNYSVYQDVETENRPQTDHDQTDSRLSSDTNNNEKNDKEFISINNRRKSKTYDKSSVYYQLALRLLNNIKKNNPNFKEPNLQKWADDVRKTIELDKRTPEQVAFLMDWAQRDSFWMANILSPGKLRQKFDTLLMQSKKRGKKSVHDIPLERPEHWEKPKPVTVEELRRLKELEDELPF